MFGKDLIDDIKSETSGNFEKLLVAMLLPLERYYAKLLHDAIQGLGTDEEALIEVLCTSSNYAIKTIQAVYEKGDFWKNLMYQTIKINVSFVLDYGRRLEDDIKGDTSGHFKRLLVAMCNASRDESGVTDRSSARRDAEELFAAGELKLGTDESTFNMVLCQRNYAQLRLVSFCFNPWKIYFSN
jgi:annexin A7/11